MGPVAGIAGIAAGAILGGAVGGKGGGGDVSVNVPGPSAEERDLQREQVEILRQQRDLAEQQAALTNALLPATLEGAGLKPVYDEQGNLTGVEEIELTPEELARQGLREDIETGLLERTQAALAGELPVSPALLTELDEQERTLREQLRKEGLQPGDTPFSESMSDFFERKENILESARRADLTLSEQLGLARESSNVSREQIALQNLFAQGNLRNPAVNAFSNVAGGFDSILNRGQLERFEPARIGLQGDIANLQFSEDPFGTILGGFGGAFAGAAGSGLASSMMSNACWVSREVLGPENPEWRAFRDWMLHRAPGWFRRLYVKRGEAFSAWVRGRYRVKALLRPIMSQVAQRRFARGP